MSVKSLLENDFEFKEFMKKHQPKKADFTSVTGLKIFNTSCSIQAKPSGFCNAGLIGTACDYMFRFMVAAYIDNKRISVSALENLLSYRGLQIIRDQYREFGEKMLVTKMTGISINDTVIHKLFVKYVDYIHELTCYVQTGKTIKQKLEKICLWFAYLEEYYRSGTPEILIKITKFDDLKHGFEMSELEKLAEVFDRDFIGSKVINPQSRVLFNTDFGDYSTAIGGADADIWIDGILYDFKSSKKYL